MGPDWSSDEGGWFRALAVKVRWDTCGTRSSDPTGRDRTTRTMTMTTASLNGRAHTGGVTDAMPARSAQRSSITTTTSTATPASACTPRPRSTTAPPPRSGLLEPRRSPPPTKRTPPGSATSHPRHPSFPRSRGSTNPTGKHSSNPR